MTRATEDEITQMAREATLKPDIRNFEDVARAAVLATLAKYAPDKLPADPDEELAAELAKGFPRRAGVVPLEDFALYVIKHMREKRA